MGIPKIQPHPQRLSVIGLPFFLAIQFVGNCMEGFKMKSPDLALRVQIWFDTNTDSFWRRLRPWAARLRLDVPGDLKDRIDIRFAMVVGPEDLSFPLDR